MILVALDTDILVALLKGTPDAIEKIRQLQEDEEVISITIITAYELMKGACLSSKANENLVRVIETVSNLRTLELSLGAAEEAARIYKELRDKGKMIGEFDVLIAGVAKFYDEALVTRDEHFKTIRGLNLKGW